MASRRLTGGWQTPRSEAAEGILNASAITGESGMLEFLAAVHVRESAGDARHIALVNNNSYFFPQPVYLDAAESMDPSGLTLQEKNYG